MGFIQKVKDLFSVSDDDAYDEYEEKKLEEAEKTEQERKNAFKANSISSSRVNNYDVQRKKYDDDMDYDDGGYSAKSGSSNSASPYFDRNTNTKNLKIDRPSGSKLIPIKTTTAGNEVCIMKPYSFNDSQDICDVLLSSRVAVVNLEGLDLNLAQRIIDFLSGTVYAISGKLYNISSFIYIFAPSNVDISGDYAEIAEQSGFDIPVLT